MQTGVKTTNSHDTNCNMVTRNVGGQGYAFAYDTERRLTGVTGSATATFVYDGDGKRVKSVIGGVNTFFVGNYYEKTGSTITKYYYAGATRIGTLAPGAHLPRAQVPGRAGVRKYTIPQSMVVEYSFWQRGGERRCNNT